jgi:NAD-binding of NADP-dependent 3-hydroxyisobutyrate dehydrogenase
MAAKLVNQALVAMHAQAASEALVLAEGMGLTNSAQTTTLLAEMLQCSWGQSKVGELVLADYIATQNHEKGFECDTIRKSAAPLRNLAKDLDCVMKELPARSDGASVGVSNGSSDAKSVPVLGVTRDAITKACSAEAGLKDSAFVSLIELLRTKK